jgi:TonB-linked SusC/RagA family outer membrane protein
MRKKRYLINEFWQRSLFLAVFSLFTMSLWAQSYTIKGKVTDSNGSGVPGVSVRLDGANAGTTTNSDGDYGLSTNVKAGSYKISFSSIGYGTNSQNIVLGVQTSMSINATLKDEVNNLYEVVVIGGGLKAERRQLGNAITSVTADQLQRTGTANLTSALQGKVPGAQITQNSGDPAGGITIRLRGIKSIQGSSDPLYIIDGVVVSNASSNVSQTALGSQINGVNPSTNRLADINPNDIETINILNGAAAAAQYGSRAANGVVLITTKRGKSGTPKVTFSTSFNTNELRKKVFVSTYGKQFGFAGLRLHTIGSITAAQLAANPGTTVSRYVRDGANFDLATNQVDVTRYDYQDNIFRSAQGTDNNVSVSGGNDRTQYFVSASYMKNEGIVRDVDFSRYGVRARVEQRLADWAKLSAGLSYTNSFSNEKANGNVFYSPINSINITNNIYDLSLRDGTGALLAVEPTRVNPLSTIEDMTFTQAVNRTINDIQLNLTPFKGFSVDWVLGVDAISQLGKNLIKPYPYQATAGLPLERYPSGYASNANSNSLLLNSDLNISYEREVTKDIRLNLIAGGNYQYQQTDFTRASGEGLAPFIETVSGASSTTVTAGYGLSRFVVSGVFGQATVGFKNLLFLTGAVRRDGSSVFSPEQTNQIYPKVSGSFIASDLDFWKNSTLANTINSAKLRFSYGQAGNLTGLGVYDRFWQFSPAPFLGRSTILPGGQLANPAVKPERMTETEGGIDLAFLKNKITLGLSVYKQQITDLVVNRTLAPSSGGSSIVNNVGSMENKGFEVALGITPIKTKDLQWDMTIIYNQNRNKITSLGGSTATIGLPTPAGAPVFLIQGQPASIFYEFPYARNTDGTLLLTPQGLPQRERGVQSTTDPTQFTAQRGADGQPSGAFVSTIIGNPNPDWTGSFMSNVSYKNLRFNFLLDAVQGVNVFNADKRTRNNVGIGDIAEQELKGTSPRGSVLALVPISEYRVDDGSFVKLREIGLSYSMPKPVKGISNAVLSVTGRNLFSWDKYNGYDPETNAGGNNDMLRGIDFGNVPIPRTYQIQLTLSF